MKGTQPLTLLLSATMLFWTSPLQGQSEPPEPNPQKAEAGEQEQPVAVWVNGQPILESEIEELFYTVIQRQTGRRELPAGMIEQAKTQLWPNLQDALIAEELLEQDVEKSQITVSNEILKEEFKRILDAYLFHNHSTFTEFKEQLRDRRNMSLKEFIDERVNEPEFKQTVLQERLLENKFPEDVRVSDQEVRDRYQSDLEKVYTQPEMVRASHILIQPEGQEEEQRKTAQSRAQKLLKEVKQQDADFADLARQHSSCPSKAQGGDLGYFPKEGAMLEPFAAAAFGLKKGQISDVVETRAGYHIIKLTGRKDEKVIPLEEARESIRHQIKNEKIAQVKEQYVEELKKSAEIVYPESGSPG